jgi:hypothetical protein
MTSQTSYLSCRGDAVLGVYTRASVAIMRLCVTTTSPKCFPVQKLRVLRGQLVGNIAVGRYVPLRLDSVRLKGRGVYALINKREFQMTMP